MDAKKFWVHVFRSFCLCTTHLSDYKFIELSNFRSFGDRIGKKKHLTLIECVGVNYKMLLCPN